MKSFKQILQTISEAKATKCGRCGTTHVAPKDGGKCPAVDEAYKDMTPAERDAFAAKVGDRARAVERSKKVSSMGAYKGRRVRKEEEAKPAASQLDEFRPNADNIPESVEVDEALMSYGSSDSYHRYKTKYGKASDEYPSPRRSYTPRPRPTPQKHAIHKNGKPLMIKGKPVHANDAKHAQNLISKLKDKPFNKDHKFTAHPVKD